MIQPSESCYQTKTERLLTLLAIDASAVPKLSPVRGRAARLGTHEADWIAAKFDASPFSIGPRMLLSVAVCLSGVGARPISANLVASLQAGVDPASIRIS
jgi:hypothetical protein